MDHIFESAWHMKMALIRAAARENSKFFHFMIILVMPQILETWELCHNMLCGWQMSYSKKMWVFLRKFWWSAPSWKLEGPHEVILVEFPFFFSNCRASNMCTKFILFQVHQVKVVHNHHLVRRKKAPPKTGIICERYWLLNLAPTFEQHMEPLPQKSNANLINILHAWSLRFSYVILTHMIVGTTLHY